MISFPNCKINLGLYVTNRRSDGYHDLETIFYPIKGLHDALEIMQAKETALHISGKTVAGNKEDNLIWKAYQMLKHDYPIRVEETEIHLLKAIPMGAGLGGGSADGTFMLALLNKYYKLGLTEEALADYALRLGSDCPFFIYNTPQYATGRGENMTPVDIDLSNFSLQLVCPQVHISTAKAFQLITPKPAGYDLRGLAKLSVSEWKNNICNDFEQPVFEQHPQLADIKQQLYNSGALYAAMSGTGSTIYGLFPKGQKAVVKTELNCDIIYLSQQ